jgi:hypothetical protein
MIAEVRPRVPEKGEHVPIERQIELGRELLAIKGKLPHGHFRRWVEDHSGLSYKRATQFIKAAKARIREAAQRDQRPVLAAMDAESAAALDRADIGQTTA